MASIAVWTLPNFSHAYQSEGARYNCRKTRNVTDRFVFLGYCSIVFPHPCNAASKSNGTGKTSVASHGLITPSRMYVSLLLPR